MTTRLSTSAGDAQSRRLRAEVISIVKRKRPDVHLSGTQTLDQLVRLAAKAGVRLTIGEKP